MDFSPLSQLTNHIIAGLNELRQCAAIGVSASVHHQLVVVIECVFMNCVNITGVYCICCVVVCVMMYGQVIKPGMETEMKRNETKRNGFDYTLDYSPL